MLDFAIRKFFHMFVLERFRPVGLNLSTAKTLMYQIPFFVGPFDVDLSGHMNQAAFYRLGEIAQFRVAPTLGVWQNARAKNANYLMAEQRMKFLKEVPGFKKVIVETRITTDNKWLNYTHIFRSPELGDDNDRNICAILDIKIVLKERSGKTIRINELLTHKDVRSHAEL